MNPLLAAALAQLEQAAQTEAITVLTLIASDLAAGKSVVDTMTDVGMMTAEQQAKALDDAMKAAGL